MSTHFKIVSVALLILALATTGCTPSQLARHPFDESDVVRVSMTLEPLGEVAVPKGTRVVVGDIAGTECATEVRDALLARLIDNPHYDVLSRDNLPVLQEELNFGWSGEVNSETASALGEMLGASVFITGRVSFCGLSAGSSPDTKLQAQHNIRALLHIIDLPTGKVVFSSTAEGIYVPRFIRPPGLANFKLIGGGEESEQQPERNWFQQFWHWFTTDHIPRLQPQNINREQIRVEPEQYARTKAAEEMAHSFADKFFGRPLWQQAEMWSTPKWRYDTSIHFVKLGYCGKAVQFMRTDAATQLSRMNEYDVAKYLHNFGVALLCDNQLNAAMQKLRAAYRLGYNQTTLKMLGIAARMQEFSSRVVNTPEAEVDGLIQRLEQSTQRQALNEVSSQQQE